MDDAGIAPQSRKAVPEQYVAGSMEIIVDDVEIFERGFWDSDAFGIVLFVKAASDLEAGIGFGGGDQLDDDLMAEERLAAPIDADEREHAVFDAVPFAGAGRMMGDRDGKPGFVGELLEFGLP